ncbi:MAG TPA: ATP-binding cassette domain-containing protein, partial [Gemmatimonadales bacterium]|nr:ATP-binding cassette domain-containing protein [Gemmatimonadales bacterium]
MLAVERLVAGYGGSQILWSVDLTVPAGQVVCLMGRNGVGKTTLLRVAVGLVRPQWGRVLFGGEFIPRPRLSDL